MTRVSFSRVDTWRQCPFKYKCRYIDGLPSKPDLSATNPLVLGSTLDLGIQEGYEKAEEYYWNQYPVASDEGVLELMKIEHWLPQLRERFRRGEFQVELKTDRFIGYIDYLEGEDLLVDFKYSNNTEKYGDSAQIHVYASELPKRPKKMAYVCIPKFFIQKKLDGESTDEYKERQAMLEDLERNDLRAFRKYVMDEVQKLEIQTVWVEYDQSKVDDFWRDADAMLSATEFIPTPNDWCQYCDYKAECKGKRPHTRKPRAKTKDNN